MRLSRIDLRHFRNLGVQELHFPPEGVALVGDNAQGKSNLLEAIYYLEIFRSFRGARDDQLVAFGEEFFRIEADLGSAGDTAVDGGVRLAVAYQTSGRRKKVTLDGAEVDRIGRALGHLGAVIFSPADIALISEGPGERRRFLDIVLSLHAAGYLDALQAFRHALSQRNAALKTEQSEGLIRIWDDALVEAGARVIAERAGWIRRWDEAFGEYYRRVSGTRGARMEYLPNVKSIVEEGQGEGSQDVASQYREALGAGFDRDRRMKTTTVGPHRDEMGLWVSDGADEIELREFGSGGQRRTAALALRLVEADTIRTSRGEEPVILLDDVFAELDDARSERILALIEAGADRQVILTAPKEADVKVRGGALPRWRIADGRVTPS